MARKAGQLISRGPRTWLVRVFLGREPESGTRKYHNKTIRGSFVEAQTYLYTELQERGIGRLKDHSILPCGNSGMSVFLLASRTDN